MLVDLSTAFAAPRTTCSRLSVATEVVLSPQRSRTERVAHSRAHGGASTAGPLRDGRLEVLYPGLGCRIPRAIDDPGGLVALAARRVAVHAAIVAVGVIADRFAQGPGDGVRVHSGQRQPSVIAVHVVEGEVPEAGPGAVRRIDLSDPGLEVVAPVLLVPECRGHRAADLTRSPQVVRVPVEPGHH